MRAGWGRVARGEWLWVLGWSVVAVVVTSFPYCVGLVVSSPELQFGGMVYNVQDINGYLAKMNQGARGEWLFHIPYTAEEHPGTIFFLFHRLLGKAAALTGLSLEWTYHLARIACGVGLLLTVYCFLAAYTPHRAVRRIAFLLIAFSGGLGWLFVLLGRAEWAGSLPLDMILPEGYLFLVLYSVPHIALAVAGMLWSLLFLRRASRLGSPWWALAAGATLLGVGLLAAFYILIPYAVLGVDWLATALRRRKPDWRAAGLFCLSGVLPALVLGYNLYYFTFDPVYSAWAAQNIATSPHPLHYIAGYLIVGALALRGIGWAVKKHMWSLQLPILWIAITPLLVYLPFGLQRRLVVGVQVPLGLMAALGMVYGVLLPVGRSRLMRWLSRFPRYSKAKMRRFLAVALVLATVPTYALLIAGNSVQVLGRSWPIFHQRAELDMLDWLRAHTLPCETVLCAYETGNYVPARAGNRVFLGIGSETIRIEEKRAAVRRFFAADTDHGWRRALLADYGIAYVVIGPYERQLGDFSGDAAYLSLDYANESYRVYRVVNP